MEDLTTEHEGIDPAGIAAHITGQQMEFEPGLVHGDEGHELTASCSVITARMVAYFGVSEATASDRVVWPASNAPACF